MKPKKRFFLLPIRLSDTERTVVAYFAMFFSILCVILSCVTTTYSCLQHIFIDDISRLVRGYYASNVLLTISIIGFLSGTVCAVGGYICFRVSGSQDRKDYNVWLIVYIVGLIIVVIGVSCAMYMCYAGLQKPIVGRSFEVVIVFITFRVSRRRREMYCGHARLCVSLSVRTLVVLLGEW